MEKTEIDKQEIDSLRLNGQIYKVGYDAYAAYDFISRISKIQAYVKNGIVVVNIYHKLDQVFDEGGYIRDVKSDKQYLFRTFYAPRNLEIRYKNSGIYEECEEAQKNLLSDGGKNESIS